MEQAGQSQSEASEREELGRLVEEFKTAMLVTRGPDGHYRARPMALQHQGPEDGLWFCTSLDSEKIKDLRSDPHCAVAMHSTERSASYVSLSGRAEVLQDRALIHQMWRPDWKAWFPDGPDSPELVLVRFRPEHVEYMNPKAGKVKVLLTMLHRLVTHQKVDPAKKHEVDFH